MTKEKIQALIFADTDEQELAKELVQLFNKNPELLQERYVADRTFFHLLVLKNKARTLELLLDNDTWKPMPQESWRKVAALSDRSGDTLVHYMVRADVKFQTALRTLLNILPTLPAEANKDNSIPLYDAIKARNSRAIKTVVGGKQCDVAVLNNAFQLCQTNTDLLRALFSTDFIDTKYFFSLKRWFDQNMGPFRSMFPILSSASSPRKNETSEQLSLEASSAAQQNDKVAQEVSSDEVNTLLKQMTAIFKEQKRSETYRVYHNQFILLCLNYLFPADLTLSQELLQQPEVKDILAEVLTGLSNQVETFYFQNEEKKYKLLKSFIFTVIPLMTKVAAEAKPTPIVGEHLDLLWLLVSGQEDDESKRIYNFEAIGHRALGVLSFMSLFNVLVGLRQLYPHFDLEQKLAANFIVLQLLYYNAINKVTSKADIGFQLQLFCRFNVDAAHGLASWGQALNLQLNHMYSFNAQYTDHPLLRNFTILNNAVNHPQIVNTHQPFDDVVSRALSKKSGARPEEVQIIANELRVLSLRFYQQVSIGEFYGSNWLKEEKNTLSPNIVESARHLNDVSNYFVAKLLTQPVENFRNAIQLMIEIGLELCPLDERRYNDVNQLMTIYSILNSGSISRAINLEKESAREYSAVKEIELLLDGRKNYKFMRELYNACRTTLPFVGELLTTVTFGNEGNETVLRRCEASGAVFRQLMDVKLLLNFDRINPQTNLLQMLAHYTPVNEDVFYNISYRRQPRANDVITLADTPNALVELLDTLERDFFAIEIIPSVIVKKRYQPSQIPELLIKLFKTRLESVKKEGKGKASEDSLDSIFMRLRAITIHLIELLNTHYVPLKLSETQDLKSFMGKFETLEKLLNELKNPPVKNKLDENKFFKRGNSSADGASARSGSDNSSTPRSL